MPMPMPPGATPPPQDGGGDQPQAGGAAELVAGIGSDLMKLNDIVGAKFPEEGQKLGQIVQAFQAFVDGLSAGPGAQGPQAAPGNVPPEAGGADVKQAM